MSVAVLNWVTANSPTSGNERLVPLALADACSRDDCAGCWSSAATIARALGADWQLTAARWARPAQRRRGAARRLG